MKLDVFRYIDDAWTEIQKHEKDIKQSSKRLLFYFKKLFKDNEEFVSIKYRIKEKDSIKEKIIRQNYYLLSPNPKDILKALPDVIGLRIACRFNNDEKEIYQFLKEKFTETRDSIYYYYEGHEEVKLEMRAPQPKKQKNGYDIYKIRGWYTSEKHKYRFELQIKSMVNAFWSDIDHRILYKNFNFVMKEEFLRDLMDSINYNLTTIDKQLYTIYGRLNEREENDMGFKQFDQMISQMTHSIYSEKVRETLEISMDIRRIVLLVVLFLLSELRDKRREEFISEMIRIMNRLSLLSSQEISLGEKFTFGRIDYDHRVSGQFGEGLQKKANEDFRWNLVLRIIVDITGDCPTKIVKEFAEFVFREIKEEVDRYVYEMNLSMEDKKKLSLSLSQMFVHYTCKEYRLEYFSTESIEKIHRALANFLGEVQRPEELMALDMEGFYRIIEKEYETPPQIIGEEL